MKKVCLLIALLLASFAMNAHNDTIRPPRLKVGVVLGGGGAKGASHIGVLKYIEDMGIPVDYVAGTSMGSIIGGLYALGYTPDELTQLIASMDWSEYIGNKIDRSMMSEEARLRNATMVLNVPFSLESLFDRDPNSSFISQLPSAYVNNSSLINLFNNLCVGYQEEMDFNDLPIPFACVATDMITGDEVVLRSGSVPAAMRASMAIPGLFSPVAIGDKLLVDGGLVNNFPADVLRDMGADIIIGVEVTSNKDVTIADLKSLPQLFARLVTNSTSAKRVERFRDAQLYARGHRHLGKPRLQECQWLPRPTVGRQTGGGCLGGSSRRQDAACAPCQEPETGIRSSQKHHHQQREPSRQPLAHSQRQTYRRQ